LLACLLLRFFAFLVLVCAGLSSSRPVCCVECD
jgi:hypothetical protein